MPVMKISRQGLCSIAVLTGILWGCLFAERLAVTRARVDAYRAIDEIRALQLKKSMIPAATPALPRRPATTAVG